METLTAKQLEKALGYDEPPVFSLYMPTHRTHSDNATDARVFDQLIQQFEPLKAAYANDERVQRIFGKFDALATNCQFWQHAKDGLVVFATRNSFDVYRLPRSVQPLAVVADSAHTKPLLKYLQAKDRYHLLVLTANTAQLYEGDRYQLDEVDLSEDVPETMMDALDHEMRDLHATLASYQAATGEKWGVAQNHGLKKTDIDNDIEQFFRAVDRAVITKYSVPSGLPLMLAALPEHHHLFRRVSRNQRLLEEGIKANASAMDKDAIRKLAWNVIEPDYTARLEGIIAQYRHAASQGLGTDQIAAIARDAYDGKVGALLLEEDRIIPGRINNRTDIFFGGGESGHLTDDVLDDLAELVLEKQGEVWIMPKDRMPASTGAASINRF
ncbi:baeRF3 domain-containing protein [Parapedobacter sp.]